MPFNTRNPIPSGDLRDLDDNARNIDTWANDKTKLSHPDRFGVERYTWHGIEQKAQLDIADAAHDAAAEATKDAEKYRDQALDAKNAAQTAAMMSGFSKYAETLAQLEAGIGTDYVDGDVVMVFQDESRDDASAIYKVESGDAVFQNVFDKTRQDLLSFTGNISPDAQWGDVPAHSDPAFDVQAQALADRTEALNKRTDGLLNVRAFIETPIDGVTSNQGGIEAAVAAAYAAGAELEWPAGTYFSTGSIPNFWKVQHRGKGVIKRGTSTFTVSPRGKSTALNQLFVSLTGSDSNDGLTADYPLRTAQAAFDAIMSVGTSIGGRWVVNFESGTYNEYATLSGVTTREAIIVRGPDVSGGVPSVVFDGNGLSEVTLNGLQFSERVNVTVRDIKFINWTGASGVGAGDASSGLHFNRYAIGWADNVHADNCGTGIYFTHSRGYVGRGVIQNCYAGTIAFAGTQIALGYGSATRYKNNQIGAIVRDGSNGVIENGVFEDNVIAGVHLLHQSIVRVSNSAFSGSGRADVVAYTGSSVFFGTGNTHTTGKKFKGEFAIDLDNSQKLYYDGDLDRFSFGKFGTPNYPFHFKTSITGAYPLASSILCAEGENPHLGLAAKSASDSAGIHIAVPGVSQHAGFQYVGSDSTWRLRLNNTDAFRWSATFYTARTDNAVSLGASSYRWTQVYAANGTINTSDEREKQQWRDQADAEKAAALEIKSAIKAFKFTDAVSAKGEVARWHFGVGAQTVGHILRRNGLNPEDYAFWCYDEWDEQQEIKDEDGNIVQEYRAAGNRYGIRYDELAMFILAAM